MHTGDHKAIACISKAYTAPQCQTRSTVTGALLLDYPDVSQMSGLQKAMNEEVSRVQLALYMQMISAC